MTAPDIVLAVLPVTELLDGLGVPYYVGGSVASSVYGTARATLDVDLVAGLGLRHIPTLARTLRGDYYVDELMIADAVERRSSFNLIHLPSSVKIDVFVLPEGAYHEVAMGRRRRDTLEDDASAARLFVASPEDVILSKLEWFELGGRVSERQWLDVTGVIKVQAGSLDTAYLQRWARELGLTALLLKAFGDSDVPLP